MPPTNPHAAATAEQVCELFEIVDAMRKDVAAIKAFLDTKPVVVPVSVTAAHVSSGVPDPGLHFGKDLKVYDTPSSAEDASNATDPADAYPAEPETHVCEECGEAEATVSRAALNPYRIVHRWCGPCRDKIGKQPAEAIADETPEATAQPKPRDLFDKWNELAKQIGLRQAQRLTKKRKGHANARIKDGYLERWPEIEAAIRGSDWHQGNNEKGWVADFDWFLHPDKVWTLVEKSAPVESSAPQREVHASPDVHYVWAMCTDQQWHLVSMGDLRDADCLDKYGNACRPGESAEYRLEQPEEGAVTG